MNKRFSILFIFMLLFQSISGGLVFAEGAKEASGDSIFTDVQLTDSEGQEADMVNAHIGWTLEGIVIEDVRDTYTLSLPEQLQVEGEKQGDVVYENETLGSYELSVEGVLTVLFNENHQEYEDASGEIVIDHLAMKQTQESEQNPDEESGTSGVQTENETNASKKAASEDEAQSADDQSGANSSVADKAKENNQTKNGKNPGKEENERKPADEKESKVESVAKEDKERTVGTFVEIQENIFTFKSLTHDGKEIVDGSIIDISDGTKVELEFKWDTKGLDAKSGDTASMQLPDVFKQVTTPKQDIITSGINVGTYSIQDGELIFEFNDRIEDGDVSNGKVGLNLNFDLQKFQEDIEQVIHFNDSVNTTLNVTARPDPTASGITKEGHADQKHNASEITWTIDVINNSGELVTDAKLKDSLPDGLGSPENLVVKSLSTALDGNKVLGDEVDNFSGNVTDGIGFGKLKPFEGYRVEFTTPVTDKDKTEFTNKASFYNGTKDLPASATVDGLTTSNPIEKSGKYNKETGQIDWTIVANDNGTNIDNATIEDTLPKGLTLDDGSLKVNKYVDGSLKEVAEDQTAFPVELGETAANEHYEITFSTDINYEVVNDGAYQKDNKFKNTATLKDGGDELGADDATVDFAREPLLEKTGTSNVNYDDKTLSWTIDVNKAKHPLNDLEITDLIPKGLSIEESDIKITDEDGNDFTAKNININPTDNDVQKEVVMDLGDIGTKHLTIEYKTKITNFNENAFNNTASIGGDGIGEGNHDTGHEITPPGNSFDKNFESIDYNEKTMDWSLKVDPKREAITSLKIEDTFPNKGMILDPSTVTVSHSKDGDLTKDDDYTLVPRTDGYHKGFIIEITEDALPLDGGHLDVEYTTSYDPQFKVEGNTLDPYVNTEGQERVYVNQANFDGTTENGNEFDVNKKASTKVREDSWNSGKKEGQRVHENNEGNLENGWQSGSERKIAWQLYTNYQKQDLGSDVTITDTLEYEGTIDEDSIKVSTYDVNADGKTTINEDSVLDLSKYTVDVSGDQFTLTFNETVTERYVVEFLTTVPKISQKNYTNGAIVKVGDEEYPYEGTVDYDKADDFLDKSAVGQEEGSNVYIGDKVNWEVDVNDSLSIIENADITDTISAGLEYVEGTLEVSTKDGNSLSEGTDYTLSKTKTEAGKTVLTIELKDTLDQALTLNYTTVVTAEDGDTVNNEISLNGENIETKTITSEELTAEQFSWVEGEFNENRGALKIVKADSETGEAIANNPATFELYYNLNGERVQFGDQFQTNENGELLIGNLPLRIYYVQEVEAPTGYIIDENEQEIDITDPYGAEEKVYEMEFTNTIEKTDISVTKEWDDAKNQDGTRPDDIDVQLLAYGDPIGNGETLSEKNDWTNTWEELDAYQSNGQKIDYTVQEVDVPKGYESTTEKNDDGNITITNTHEPETIEVSVSKKWEDENDQDGVRPNNVKVNLLDGSEVVTEVVLDESNEWQHTFTDLPKFADGEEIDYSVTEDSVEHYSTNVKTTNTDEGLVSVITNSYTPEETTATVTKVWEDGNNQDGNRPKTVTIQLLADGNPHGDPVEVAATDKWTYTWEGLDLNSDGEAIEYTVEEVKVPNDYEVSLDNQDHGNLVITNAYEPETTEISVAKSWEDNSNQDGVRPDNVTVNLLADGEIEKSAVLNDKRDWEHTFTDLPVNENGEKIKYTITENTVPEYSASVGVDPETDNGYVVTNTHTPAETSATVTKAWDDEGNQDGNRPDSIDVQLTADGEPVGETVTLSKDNNWTHTWNELDLYADGDKIDYSVKELDVPEGYTETINDDDHGNIIITNSYTPESTEVPVTKTWADADDQDGERPAHITLNLLNDRGEIVKSAVVQDQDSNEWQYTFTDIPKYENGKEINYRVTEDFVSDYSTTIEKNPEVDNGFVVKNAYTPKETSVSVTKGWNDEDNQDGKRPDSIDVQLTADGEPVGEPVTISEDYNWTHTWNELDLYADGKEVNYSVEEMNVPKAYTVTINDKNHGNIMITNSYTPELTEVPMTKTWLDDNSEGGERPDAITVDLLANSKITETVVITEADDWTYNFTNLPKYESGEEIEYTITEDAVKGYDTTIDGYNITNLRVGETEVMGEKTWLDNNSPDRPESITVKLLANGEETGETVTVDADSDWKYAFTKLDKYDDQGKEIVYSVDEEAVDGYEKSISGNDITNLRVGKTAVTVEKLWDEVDDRYRPDHVTVDLLANGDAVETQEITADTDWLHTFSELDKYDDQGKEITYTVEEVDVPAGYKSEVDGFNITNTQKSTDVTGEKTWIEVDDRYRPDSITVQLLANGEKETTVEVSAQTDWTYAFTDLAKYDKSGEEITYTVEEAGVPAGYESEVDGFTITNTQDATAVTGEKTWSEVDDRYRPDTITVNLLANGAKEQSAEVSKATNWMYTFTDLAKYDKEGNLITYTIEEEAVTGYTSKVNGYDVTNTQQTTEVSGTKTWLDDHSKDRPEVIAVQLKNGEEIVQEQEVTAENDWGYTFTNLPKYDKEGNEIKYTIDEVDVSGYKKTIDGNDITNLRVGTTEVTITKAWKDEQDTERPDTITVNLLQNGSFYGEYDITKEGNWELTITDLPQYDEQGKVFEYTVNEHDVAGYAAQVDGFNITNTRTDEKDITITKTWLDDHAEDRPSEIEVELVRFIADGEKEQVNTLTMTAKDDWTLTVEKLPAFDADGKAYTYEVIEKPVDGYETTINGFDITNTQVGLTDLEVSKTWKGDTSEDRPETIIVDLLQNGEVIETVDITSDMDWTYTFTELDQYDDQGVAYVYSVQEHEVKGYTSMTEEVDGGFEITNTLDVTPSEPEDPKDPQEPEDPNDSGDLGTPTDPSDPSDPAQPDNTLPKTATNMYNMLIIGFLLAISGIGLLVYRRIREA